METKPILTLLLLGWMGSPTQTLVATPSPIADTFTIFNPEGIAIRSASLTVAQEHGGATQVVAVSLEKVPGPTGMQLPLLNPNAGTIVLVGPGNGVFPGVMLPPGTAPTDVFGIFMLSSSPDGPFFLNFSTGDAIHRLGSPDEFALVTGAPIAFAGHTRTGFYDATSFLSPEAMGAGYTAAFVDIVPDAGATALFLGLSIGLIVCLNLRISKRFLSKQSAEHPGLGRQD